MRITHACPACGATVAHDAIESLQVLDCPACRATLRIPEDAIVRSGSTPKLRHCLVCRSREFFVRKDFPQRVGLAIVVVGLAASCVAWAAHELVATFAILFATALLDLLLYLFMPECLNCYRCNARYRGDGVTADFGGFDLETHEKHRQQRARSRELAAARAADGPH